MLTNSASFFISPDLERVVNAEIAKESRTLNAAKERKGDLQRMITGYELLKDRLTALQSATKELYGHRSPFRKLIGTGDGIEDYFEIEAKRTAEMIGHTVEITRVAKNQKFASAPVKRSHRFPRGTFTVKVSGSEKSIRFRGGNLTSLRHAITTELGKDVKITMISKSHDEQILIIEAALPGKENAFSIVDDPEGVLAALDLFTKEHPRFVDCEFEPRMKGDLINEGDDSANYRIKRDMLYLYGANRISLPLTTTAKVQEGLELSLAISYEKRGEAVASTRTSREVSREATKTRERMPRTDPGLDGIDGVNFDDISVEGEGLVPFPYGENEQGVTNAGETNETATNTPPPPAEEEPRHTPTGVAGEVVGVTYTDMYGQRQEQLFYIEDLAGEWRTFSIPLTDYLTVDDTVTGVVFYVDDDDVNVGYKDVVLQNGTITEQVPKQVIQRAENSRVLIDGVAVEKDGNNIEDVLEGITIKLKKPTPYPMEFTLEPDRELIVNTTVTFLRMYNQTVMFINDLTATPIDDAIAESAADMSLSELMDIADTLGMMYDENVSEGELRRRIRLRGIFNGDIAVTSLNRKMRSIMTAPYPTRYGKELNILFDIGISTGRAGSAWSKIKKGFMDIEEDTFFEQIEARLDGVGELFGSDQTGDAIIDTGVAFNLSEMLQRYIQLRGLIDTAIARIETSVDQEDKTIEREEDRVARAEQRIRQRYMEMEQRRKQAEEQMKRLNNSFNGMNK